MISRRFIRIWLGPKPIPELFETWWRGFQELHPGWEFVTIRDAEEPDFITSELEAIYHDADTYAGRSDVLRLLVLHQLGGVYVDTDVMPLRSFEPLLAESTPFAAQRSKKSFESAVIGCPAEHPAMTLALFILPKWYWAHQGHAASVRTGPAFLSHAWFGRPDVRHLPPRTFYPYNGFGAPKRDAKLQLFADQGNFPPEMLAAHLSDHRWGGRPR